jgi:hypothetical protein
MFVVVVYPAYPSHVIAAVLLTRLFGWLTTDVEGVMETVSKTLVAKTSANLMSLYLLVEMLQHPQHR